MVCNFLTRLSLLSRFTVVSFFVTLSIAAGLAWRLESTLERDALWAVAENAADRAANILNANLHASDFEAPLDGNRYERVNTLIHETLFTSGIVRTKLWNRDGRLIYSDERSLVGQHFPLTEELESAFNGRMATELSSLEEDENVSERGLYTRLFEVYVPIRPADAKQILGAYEIYYDLNLLQPRLMRIRNTVWSGVGIGCVLLYETLFLLVRNASRQLIQRNAENRRLLAAEHEQRQLSDTLARVSLALSGILDLRKVLDLICEESTQVFGAQAAFLWLIEGEELIGGAKYFLLPISQHIVGRAQVIRLLLLIFTL